MIASLLSDIALPHTFSSTWTTDPWNEAYKTTTSYALALADSEFKVRSLTLIAPSTNSKTVFFGPASDPSRALAPGTEKVVDIPLGATVDLATWYILAADAEVGQDVYLQYCR